MKDFEVTEQIITRESEPIDLSSSHEDTTEPVNTEHHVGSNKVCETEEPVQKSESVQSNAVKGEEDNKPKKVKGLMNPTFLNWWDDVVEVDRED